MRSRQLMRVVSLASFLLFPLQSAMAQFIGGDEIQSTVSNAGTYLQRLALLLFVITLIIGAIRMAASSTRDGLAMVIGSMIGIAVTALAPQIVNVVQSWAGGNAVMGF